MTFQRNSVQRLTSGTAKIGVALAIAAVFSVPIAVSAAEIVRTVGSGNHVFTDNVIKSPDGCGVDFAAVHVFESVVASNQTNSSTTTVYLVRGGYNYCTGSGYYGSGELPNAIVQFKGHLNAVSVVGTGTILGWSYDGSLLSLKADIALDLRGAGEVSSGTNSTQTNYGPIRTATRSEGAYRDAVANGVVAVNGEALNIIDGRGAMSDSKTRTFTIFK